MKNIILAFFTLTFCCQLFGGESQRRLMCMAPYIENDLLENNVDLFAHVKALEIAAEENNKGQFKALLLGQSSEQKKESIEFFKKMSGRVVPLKREDKSTEDIDKKLSFWIEGDNIKSCMAYYRGEILNSMLSKKIRDAISGYKGKASDESDKKTIEKYAFVKSIQKNRSDNTQISPFEYAIKQYCGYSLSLLLELTQGRAAQHCQWNEIKRDCSFWRVELFLQYNLIDLVVNIFCEQARRAGTNGEQFVAYNKDSSFPSAFKALINYLESEQFDESILKKTDEDGNTLLHAAVCLQDEKLVEALLKKGAKVETQNNKGNTALHEAWIRANGLLSTVKANSLHEFNIREAKVALEKMHRIIELLREKAQHGTGLIANKDEKRVVDLGGQCEKLTEQLTKKVDQEASLGQNTVDQAQKQKEQTIYSADQLQRECDKIAIANKAKEMKEKEKQQQQESPPKIQSSGSFPHKTIFAALLGAGLFAFIYWYSFYQSHVAAVA